MIPYNSILGRTALAACLCVAAHAASANETTEHLNSVAYKAAHGDDAAMNQLGAWYYNGTNVERDFGKAFQWWHRAAMRQNLKSIANIGVCYQYGRGVDRDTVAALDLYLLAIGKGQQSLFEQRLAGAARSPFDAVLMGMCYERGIGTEKNQSTAARMYTLAAEQGSTDAYLPAGRAWLGAGKTDEAVKYLGMAADKGDSEAQYLLGCLYRGGRGVKADPTRALTYLRKAATAGHTGARAVLGKMYIDGDGVYTSRADGLAFLRDAAMAGDARAMYDYAAALADDTGDDADYATALLWFAQAARAGYATDFNSYIYKASGAVPFKGYVEGMRQYLVEKDYQKAAASFRKMGKGKSAEGKVMAAVVMADPANPRANTQKAVRELSALAATSAHAATALARIYASGTAADTGKAMELAKFAVGKGYAPAYGLLADLSAMRVPQTDDPAELYGKALDSRTLSEDGRQRLMEILTVSGSGDAETMSKVANYDPDNNVAALLKGIS